VAQLVQLRPKQFGVSGGQTLPQPPQFLGSLEGFTHRALQQIISSGHGQSQQPQFTESKPPFLHTRLQQSGFSPEHSLLHAPQWSTSSRLSHMKRSLPRRGQQVSPLPHASPQPKQFS
jgi:hypothetical protein